MCKKGGIFSFAAAGVLFAVIFASVAIAQPSLQIRHTEPALAEGGKPLQLTFSTPGINAGDVEDAFVFYRYDSDLSYRQKNASLYSAEFNAELQVETADNVSVLEYYFEVQLHNGDKIIYPSGRESEEPVRVAVVSEKESAGNRDIPVDFTILSPEAESAVAANDVIIAITLFYSEMEIDTANSSFRLMMDGRDVTEEAEASDYFFSYVPAEISPGTHYASLLYQTADTVMSLTRWNFTVADPGESAVTVAESAGSDFLPRGQLEFSARSQQVGGFSNDVLSGNVRLSGQRGNISYSAHGLITSQEDPRLQPQNRYGIELYMAEWLELQAGHLYPSLSPLTISGQRMQGVNAGFHFMGGAVNLRLIHGNMRRGVSNLYDTVFPVYQESGGAVADTTYTLNFREKGVGNYERELTGGRLEVGRENRFRFGLNFLKVEDDTASISVIKNFNDLLNTDPALAQDLNSEDRQNLSAEPGMLNVNGNPRPRGNFVAAADVMFSLDNNRIRFRGDAAAGLLNQDISYGPLSQERAEEIGFYLDDQSENLLRRLSWLIIINENMSTLPFRFSEENSAVENVDMDIFFPAGILASQSELGLNYFKNHMRIRYQWVGPDFNSMANTTTRRDIAGFTVSDRIRLARDRIYLTLGFESLRDNVLNNKAATTRTTTYRSNISWYPGKTILPRVSTGFMFRSRENGIPLYNPHMSPSLRDVAVHNFIGQNGRPVLGPDSRSSDTFHLTTSITQSFDLFDISHDANVNFLLLNTRDYAFRYGEVWSAGYALQLSSRFPEKSLRTNIGFNFNNTESSGGFSEITIQGLHLGGDILLMNDRLNIDASVAFTKNRSESTPLEPDSNGTADLLDDYYEPDRDNRSSAETVSFMISAGARYNVTENHAFMVDFRYNNISGRSHRRAVPDDRLLRARYIFNF